MIIGGVLNLTLSDTMSKEECLEIVKKLDDISQNKFYTINVWDTPGDLYLGDVELFKDYSSYYTLIQNLIANDGTIRRYTYTFYTNGKYNRTYTTLCTISNILSRLDKIEQKLNEITISETN